MKRGLRPPFLINTCMTKNASLKTKYNITVWDSIGLNYWAITKCGNTSVKASLLEKTGRQIKQIDGVDAWVHNEKNVKYISREQALSNGNMNFTVTRNPYDRFVSMFKDVKRRPKQFFKNGEKIKSIDQLLEYIDQIPDHERDIHFRSQSYFIFDESGRLLVDEKFDINETARIADSIGLNTNKLNVIESEIVLNEKQKQKVANLYWKDFEHLGYMR
jgi:hypothetical protein